MLAITNDYKWAGLDAARHILATSSRAHHYMAEALSQVSFCPLLAPEVMYFFTTLGTSCLALRLGLFGKETFCLHLYLFNRCLNHCLDRVTLLLFLECKV
jgi:hypothetical protein